MSRYLVRTLVIPVSLAALMSLIIGYFIPWQGLFVNLATSFISVLITVIYIDHVLQEHDRRLWARVSRLIRERAIRFGYSTTLEIRVALGFSYTVFDQSLFNLPITEEKRKSEVKRVAEEIVNPSVLDKLHGMDNAAWKRLADALERFVKQGDSLIDLYGNKLDPELLQTILDIQSQASEALARYNVIPDILGVPEAHLQSKTPGVAKHFKNLTIQSMASAICEINLLALKLINLS